MVEEVALATGGPVVEEVALATVSKPRKLALALTAVALALTISGCGGDDQIQVGDLNGSVLDPPFTVSTDELVGPGGAPYSLAESTDKPLTMVFFGYTNCPDICGTVMGNLASAMTRLDSRDRDRVDVVFVTTDPERDTEDVLRRYLDRYDKSFIGVTGPLDEIAAVGKSVAVGMGEKLPTGGYDVDAHTTQVTGIDGADEAPIYWRQTTSSAQFAQDIHTLLASES